MIDFLLGCLWGLAMFGGIIGGLKAWDRVRQRKIATPPTPEQIEQDAQFEKRRELAAQLDEWDLALFKETGKGPHAEKLERQREEYERALKWHQEAQRIYIPAHQEIATTMVVGQPIPFPHRQFQMVEATSVATSCSIRVDEAESRMISSAIRSGFNIPSSRRDLA